jgi:hypothetical protein
VTSDAPRRKRACSNLSGTTPTPVETIGLGADRLGSQAPVLSLRVGGVLIPHVLSKFRSRRFSFQLQLRCRYSPLRSRCGVGQPFGTHVDEAIGAVAATPVCLCTDCPSLVAGRAREVRQWQIHD